MSLATGAGSSIRTVPLPASLYGDLTGRISQATPFSFPCRIVHPDGFDVDFRPDAPARQQRFGGFSRHPARPLSQY
jgi:hypothetical protein